MKTLTENEAQELGKKITSLYQSLQQVLVGQEKFLEVFLVGFFSGGHLLLEGLQVLEKRNSLNPWQNSQDSKPNGSNSLLIFYRGMLRGIR